MEPHNTVCCGAFLLLDPQVGQAAAVVGLGDLPR